MDMNIVLCLVVLLSAKFTSATNRCLLLNRVSSCSLTVVCEVYAGSISSSINCDNNPNVTFVITKSNANPLALSFFGSTNFDSKVRYIKAIDNNWPIISPAALRYYTKTVELDLSNNKITKIGDLAFQNLVLLETLNLSSNAITNLNPLSLSISSNTNNNILSVIDLSNNQLTEIKSEVFVSIINLKTLYLQCNRLTTIADDSFVQLKNLNILHIFNNRLDTFNMTLVNLKSLKELDASYNSLSRLLGYELNRLVALEKVNVSHNAIEIVEPNCFYQAFNLEVLDFSYNKIHSPIETMMFANNAKSKYLNFYKNYITEIKENAFAHMALTFFNITDNKISGEIKKDTFTGLGNILTLNLSAQNIEIIRNNSFSKMNKLTYLNLTKNRINVIENLSFVDANLLSVLDLSYNRIQNLDFFKNALTNLTELYLNNNNISTLAPKIFEGLTKVIRLDLSMNKMVKMEPYTLPLSNLQYLNIEGNLLSGTINNNVFTPAKYLRYLDLSNFNFTGVESRAFMDSPLLAKLNISNNNITVIDADNFKGFNNMYSLDLSHNALTDLEINLSFLGNLKALYLNGNNLTSIIKTLLNTSNVLYLDLSYNKISDLSEIAFKHLPFLKVLYLSYNNIELFNNPQINSLSNLTDLRLSSNNITNINLSYFKDLVSLDISDNGISYINSSFFQNLDYLQSLDLSKNNITELLPGTFQSVKILKLLNLSSNHLTTLRHGSLKGLHRTEVLDISRNNLNEIDEYVFQECTELKRLVIDYNDIKDLDIEKLIQISPKLNTISLGGNPISCKEVARSIKVVNVKFSVEVTSIDKIYHDDNVYGIRCGNTSLAVTTVSTTTAESSTEKINTDGTSSVLWIWCSVLTVLFIGAVILVFFYKRRNSLPINGNTRMQFRNSVEMNGSEFQNDLLG